MLMRANLGIFHRGETKISSDLFYFYNNKFAFSYSPKHFTFA
jgi:hypothetical protein